MKKDIIINTIDLIDGCKTVEELQFAILDAEAGIDELNDPLRKTIITGTLGLWDGTHTIEPAHCDDLLEAVHRCTRTGNDYKIVATGAHTLHVDVYHHDGINHFKIIQRLK